MTISEGLQEFDRLDTERLLLHVLQRDEPSWLYAHGDEELSEAQERAFKKLVAERKAGRPLAYLLGEWDFYGRTFYVTEDVLVPRPETEKLVDEVLNNFDTTILRNMVVCDLGTGSGCIAVTLLRQGFEGQALATDISAEALDIARENAKRHGVEDHIEFVLEDIDETLGREEIDLVVSNPPYLPSAEARVLPDPLLALDGGKNGTKFVQKIKAAGVPAVIETTGGTIQSFALDRLPA